MAKVLRSPWFYLILILLIGTILRFYQIGNYMQFLGDEGRDVLVVKQMITDHKWTLLGPTASVGGFYTGPIYYYFMLPFLWAFSLDPVGPAYMAALFGVATIALTFLLCKKFFNDRVALIASFLVMISPKMVDISRFSWNPNPVPFFTILTMLFLCYASVSKKKIFTFFAGIALGILFQLHYIDLIFGAVGGVAMLLLFPPGEWLMQFALGAAGFVVGDSLFLFFELRHGFPNTKSMLEFITRPSAVSPRSLNPLEILNSIGIQLYSIVLRVDFPLAKVFYYGSVLGTGYWIYQNYKNHSTVVKIIAAWFLVGFIGIGFYQGSLLEHYFSYLYILPFILLAVTLNLFLNKKIFWPVFLVIMVAIAYFAIKGMYFWVPPNNMVTQTKNVDTIVLDLAGDQSFNFALIAPGNSDHAYRYFLDVDNRTPVVIQDPIADPQRLSITNQLIVVCEQKCGPLGYSLWEVAGFGRAEIATKIDGPAGITIYKLIHYYGSEY